MTQQQGEPGVGVGWRTGQRQHPGLCRVPETRQDTASHSAMMPPRFLGRRWQQTRTTVTLSFGSAQGERQGEARARGQTRGDPCHAARWGRARAELSPRFSPRSPSWVGCPPVRSTLLGALWPGHDPPRAAACDVASRVPCPKCRHGAARLRRAQRRPAFRAFPRRQGQKRSVSGRSRATKTVTRRHRALRVCVRVRVSSLGLATGAASPARRQPS